MKLRKLILPLAAGAAAYYALFGGEYSLLELHRVERERAAEAARLEQVQTENRQLEQRADSLENDRATLERLARERYGMVGQDERLYRFVDSASTETQPDTTGS